MRILHVHSGNLYGGVETVLRRFCAAISPADQEFAFSFDGRIAAELRQTACGVHILGAVRARDPISVVRAQRKLAALARHGNFDATVMHSTWSLALLGRAAQRPLIFYRHDLLGGNHWTERLAQRARPDLIIANSAVTAQSTATAFPRRAAVVVHPPAELNARIVSPRRRRELRASWGTAEDDIVILTAARFEPWKGYALLVEALAKLKLNPRWVWWIAGADRRPCEKAVRAELQRMAALGQLTPRIRFLEHVADMGAVMQAADIYCQPNTGPEPFGLTFVEALHAGLPVVATRLGGAEEILAPHFGVFTDAHPEAVARALSDLIGSPELRARFRHAERARELCHPDRQVHRFLQAIAGARNALAA